MFDPKSQAIFYRTSSWTAASCGDPDVIEIARGPLVFLARSMQSLPAVERATLVIKCCDRWLRMDEAANLVDGWFGNDNVAR